MVPEALLHAISKLSPLIHQQPVNWVLLSLALLSRWENKCRKVKLLAQGLTAKLTWILTQTWLNLRYILLAMG